VLTYLKKPIDFNKVIEAFKDAAKFGTTNLKKDA
jgi:hypothetical protein